MRRYGEPPQPGRAYPDRPGAYAVIRDGGDVLVTEQAEPVREFQLPGGGIDPGEGALRALHRECLEETGWRIRVLRRLGAFQRFAYLPEYGIWARKVCHIYLARPVLVARPARRAGPPRHLDADPDRRRAPRQRRRPRLPAGVAGGIARCRSGIRSARPDSFVDRQVSYPLTPVTFIYTYQHPYVHAHA